MFLRVGSDERKSHVIGKCMRVIFGEVCVWFASPASPVPFATQPERLAQNLCADRPSPIRAM